MEKTTHEGSHEHARRHSLQVVYRRTTEKRRIYMEELRDVRKEKETKVLKTVNNSIGPAWYQVLSVIQRSSLEQLETGIYQDLIEGRPRCTAKIIRGLGIYPQPNNTDLFNCVYAGRDDPKDMLACLFRIYYGHHFHGKRSSYDLNARLMLSAILYLGLDDLIKMLEERFRPHTEVKPRPSKPKIKRPELDSPYLQKNVAPFYEPARLKRQLVLPLPNIDDIDDPYDEVPMIPKPPPPPPTPPPPKKRLPRPYCDKMADMPKYRPYNIGLSTGLPALSKPSKIKTKNPSIQTEKKHYGIDSNLRKKTIRQKKRSIPSTGIWNAQYMIQGICIVNDRCVFNISAVSLLPPLGDLIHGGFALVKGIYVNIHCGFAARPEPMKPPPCDCKKKYENSVFLRYIEKTPKCTCGHNYDYGNEGTFPADELPFFVKPTPNTKFSFNYNTIFEQDPRMLHVEKEFKNVWEADSNLNIDPFSALAENKPKEKKKKQMKKKDSNTCLGTNPKITDYLKCALRMMRPVNIAANLPDIHLVPELKEWMRYRLYGRFTARQKKKLLTKSVNIWFFLKSMKTLQHVALSQDPAYLKSTTWKHKTELSKRFKNYIHDYQLAMFRLYAQTNNAMWATMCQTQFPDKNFRAIFFSYLVSRMSDLQFMHPYSSREAQDRMLVMELRQYNCPPNVVLD